MEDVDKSDLLIRIRCLKEILKMPSIPWNYKLILPNSFRWFKKKLPSLVFFSYVNNVVLWGNKQNVNAMTSNNLHHQITMDTEMCCPSYFLCYFGDRKFHGSFWNLYLNFWQLKTNVLSLYKGPDQYILTICQDTKIFSSFSLHTMTAKPDVEVYTTCDVIWERFVVWKCLF